MLKQIAEEGRHYVTFDDPNARYIALNDPELFLQRYEPPVVVVGVLSPSTAFNDLNVKLRKYQSIGVKEYWIISQDGELVTVHYFESQTVKEFVTGSKITSELFPEMNIDVNLLF